jgi:hypothetical protein
MSNAQVNQSNKASQKLPTKAAPDPQVPTPSAPGTSMDLPTYENIREFLKGKEVTLFAPVDHWFSVIYCEPKQNDVFGHFSCVILDITIAEETGTPLNAIIQYKDRGARIWGSRDLIMLDGITISTSYLLPSIKDDEDDAAPESVTKH